MAEDLENKAKNAVSRIDSNVARIDRNVADGVEVLRDLSMKLCHIIKYKGNYYSMPKGIDYEDSNYMN